MPTRTVDLFPTRVGRLLGIGTTVPTWNEQENALVIGDGLVAKAAGNGFAAPGGTGQADGHFIFDTGIPRNATVLDVEFHVRARIIDAPARETRLIRVYYLNTLTQPSITVYTNANQAIVLDSTKGWQFESVNCGPKLVDTLNEMLGAITYFSVGIAVSGVGGPNYVGVDGFFLRLSYSYDNEDQQPNLVRNGFGEEESNANFSGFTFTKEEVVPGTRGSFKRTGYNPPIGADEMFPVDPTKFYVGSVSAKYIGAEVPGSIRLGCRSFDIDRNEISNINCFCLPQSLTTLARDLNPGDTEIHLTDGSGWAHVQFRDGIVIWNYRDSTGHLYPPESYSRLSWTGVFDAGSIQGNVVTLRNPWQGNRGTHLAGTPISQGGSDGDGQGWRYFIRSSSPTPNVWTKFDGVIGGIRDPGTRPNNRFLPGTRFIRFEAAVNTTNEAATTLLSAIYIGDVPVRQLASDLSAAGTLQAQAIRAALLDAHLVSDPALAANLIRAQLLAAGLESTGDLAADLTRVQLLQPDLLSEAQLSAVLHRVLPEVRGPRFSISPHNPTLVVS